MRKGQQEAASASHGGPSQQKQHSHTRIGLQTKKNINFCCLSYPVYGFGWEIYQIHTGPVPFCLEEKGNHSSLKARDPVLQLPLHCVHVLSVILPTPAVISLHYLDPWAQTPASCQYSRKSVFKCKWWAEEPYLSLAI